MRQLCKKNKNKQKTFTAQTYKAHGLEQGSFVYYSAVCMSVQHISSVLEYKKWNGRKNEIKLEIIHALYSVSETLQYLIINDHTLHSTEASESGPRTDRLISEVLV